MAHRLGIDAQTVEADLCQVGLPEPFHLPANGLRFDPDPLLELLFQEPVVVPQSQIGSRAFDHDGQFADVDGFLKVIEGPVLEGLDGAVRVPVAGHDDDIHR